MKKDELENKQNKQNNMKQIKELVLFLAVAAATSVYAQDYDLNSYDFRYQKYHGLTFDFNLGSNGSQSFESSQDTFSGDNSFLNGHANSSSFNFSPRYFSVTNTDALQRQVDASVRGDFSYNINKNKGTQGTNGNKRGNDQLDLFYANTSRKYTGNRFEYLRFSSAIDLDSRMEYWEGNGEKIQKSDNNRLVNETSVSYGFGTGRMNLVSDAVQAMFLLQDLSRIDGANYTTEQVEAVAQGITLIRNNRYLDFRIGYKTQLRMLDDVLQANGVSSEKSIDYFTTISDNWLYANRANRSSGSTWTHYATLGNGFEYDVTNRVRNLHSTPDYYYYERNRNQQLNTNVSINTSYDYSYQQSLYVQTSYSIVASTGLDYAINDNEYGSGTKPIEDDVISSVYGERVRWVSRLQGNYQYLYQANTRNLLTVNVSPSIQIFRDLPQYMTPAISGRKAYEILPIINANVNYYYWFSPHLNMSTSGFLGPSGAYTLNQSDIQYQKGQFTRINYNFRFGVNYQLF